MCDESDKWEEFVMGKRNILLVIVMALCSVLLLACANSADQNSSYTVTVPYDYPVLPGTEQWDSLSMDEKISLTRVDEEIVKRMTTEAVFITTLRYPFIVNVFAYGTANEGIDAVKEYCSSLAELLIREDALQVVESYLEEADNDECVEYYVADNLREYISASPLV